MHYRRLSIIVSGIAVAAALTVAISRLRRSDAPEKELPPAAASEEAGSARARRLRIETPPPSPPDRGEFRFSAAEVRHSSFQKLDLVQDRLWVSTSGGIVVIDPVNESWTTLDLGLMSGGETDAIPCGSDVWLRIGYSIALLDLKTQRFQISGPPQGLPVIGSYEPVFACGDGGLWIYLRSPNILFQVPALGVVQDRYEFFWPGGANADIAESLEGGVYFLYPYGRPESSELYRFDPRALSFEPVELPEGASGESLERTEEGLLVRTRESKAFLMKVEGEPWVEVPVAPTSGELVLAEGDGVVWVGASYDVLPASYFVLRYIQDAQEPKELVVFPGNALWIHGRAVVPYLGMLWAVSVDRVLRIDPHAEEIVTYELGADPARGGISTYRALTKKAFPLERGGAGLQYFDGRTLHQAIPTVDPSDPGEESER